MDTITKICFESAADARRAARTAPLDARQLWNEVAYAWERVAAVPESNLLYAEAVELWYGAEQRWPSGAVS